MKPCPYCAELIQELAAKCRFCGEWLDPSKRPAWSGDGTAPVPAPPAAHAAVPAPARTSAAAAAPVRTTQAFTPPPPAADHPPDVTATDGSIMQPMRSWSTPPWLAGQDADHHAEPPRGHQRDHDRDHYRDDHRDRSSSEHDAPERASLEDVSLRMEKIKQSAAAVRDSVERRPAPRPEPARSGGTHIAPDANHPSHPAPFPSESRPSPTDPILAQLDATERDTLLLSPQRGAAARAAAQGLHDLDPSRPLPDDFADDLRGDLRGDLRDELHDDLDRSVLSDEVLVDRHPGDPRLDGAPAPVQGRSAAGFEDQFLGDLDAIGDDGDDVYRDNQGAAYPDAFGDDDGYPDEDEFGGDDEFGSMTAAAAPMPWKAILAGAGVLVVAGLFIFSDAIFGSDAPDTAATTDAAADDGADAAATPTADPAPVAADGGAPVQPDPTPPNAVADGGVADGGTPVADGGTPVADGGTPVADGGTPVAPAVTPIPVDAAAVAKLDEARGLWQSAKGRNKGKLRSAQAILGELVAANPSHAEALLVLAQVQLELGATKDALQTARQCTQASAELADCWLTTGFLEQDARNKAGAKEAYEKYLQLAPDGKYAGDVKKLLGSL